MIVAIPRAAHAGGQAALYRFVLDTGATAFVAEFPNPSDLTKARFHSMVDGRVQSVDAGSAMQVTPAASSCTVNCIVNCLQSGYCNGFGLTLCVGAIVGCGLLFFPSCIAAVICSIWCGAGFAHCTCVCCGLSC